MPKNSRPADPPCIKVELSVDRIQVLWDDGFVDVAGYVGDYEVHYAIPLNDPRATRLMKHFGVTS